MALPVRPAAGSTPQRHLQKARSRSDRQKNERPLATCDHMRVRLTTQVWLQVIRLLEWTETVDTTAKRLLVRFEH